MSHTAVVILNYNGESLLRQFLPSVLQYTPEAEIIVADNASTDSSIAVLEKDFPTVRTIRLNENYGFCGGYNRALKLIKADYYVLLNSDIEVTAHWLTPLVKQLDEDARIAAVQPKVLAYHHKNKFEYAGAGGGLIDCLGYPFCRGRIFTTVEDDNGQYNDQYPVFWATGACLTIRADVYHKFGGLDEDFFAHMEEIDLCWKLHRAGYKVSYCGKSVIYHIGAGTLGYAHPRKTYLNFRNGLSLLYKHLDKNELWYKLPLRIVLDWMAAFLYIAKGTFPNAFAVLKAHAHFFMHIRRDHLKRHSLHLLYPHYPKTAIYPRPIIIDYYLKGKKMFRALKHYSPSSEQRQ